MRFDIETKSTFFVILGLFVLASKQEAKKCINCLTIYQFSTQNRLFYLLFSLNNLLSIHKYFIHDENAHFDPK